MAKLRKIDRLNGLLKKPLFTSSEAREAWVHPNLLSYYAKKGLIERIERGIYRGASAEMQVDFQWDLRLRLDSAAQQDKGDLSTAQVGPRRVDLSSGKVQQLSELNETQRRIVDYCEVPRRLAEIMNEIGVSNRGFFKEVLTAYENPTKSKEIG